MNITAILKLWKEIKKSQLIGHSYTGVKLLRNQKVNSIV